MNTYIEGTAIKLDSLREFEPILKEWLKVQRAYNEALEDEDAWAHGERACTGFLSTAAWNCGHVAIVESKIEKQSSQGIRGSGLLDLYIRQSNTNKTHARDDN